MDWVSLELDSMERGLMGSIRASNYQIDLKQVEWGGAGVGPDDFGPDGDGFVGLRTSELGPDGLEPNELGPDG